MSVTDRAVHIDNPVCFARVHTLHIVSGGQRIVGSDVTRKMTVSAKNRSRRDLNRRKDLYRVSLEAGDLFRVKLSSVHVDWISNPVL